MTSVVKNCEQSLDWKCTTSVFIDILPLCTLQHRHSEQNLECPLCYVKAVFAAAVTPSNFISKAVAKYFTLQHISFKLKNIASKCEGFFYDFKSIVGKGKLGKQTACYFPVFYGMQAQFQRILLKQHTSMGSYKKALICILSCDNGHFSKP